MVTADLFSDVIETPTAKKKGFTHDNVDNLSVEWYTPAWVFDDLKLEFDLDPAAPSKRVAELKIDAIKKLIDSAPEKNNSLIKAITEYEKILRGNEFKGLDWVPAATFYDEFDNGLQKDWQDQRVWLNPPYGTATGSWLEKMHGHRNGVALVFSRTDNAWYHDYAAKADAILFLKGRIKFVDGLGVSAGNGAAGCGSMLIAWGADSVESLFNMKEKGHLVINKC